MADDYEGDTLRRKFNLDLEGVGSLLYTSVTDVVEHRETSFNDVVNFSQQVTRSGTRVCSSEDLETLNDGYPIGIGASLAVFKARLKPQGRLVAVKRLRLDDDNSGGNPAEDQRNHDFKTALASLILELRVMMHPFFSSNRNIVDLLAIYWENDTRGSTSDLVSDARPAMVVELADEEYPTLYAALRENALGLGEPERLHFLEGISEGMTIIHAAQMVHGDLKPENILLFKQAGQYVPKISDFGFSSPYAQDTQKVLGTRYWNAPECLDVAPPSIKPFRTMITRDLYSYGLICWFVLLAEMPFGPYGELDLASIDTLKLQDGENSLISLFDAHVTETLIRPEDISMTDHELNNDTKAGLMWWQIHNALNEMFRVIPNQRNISMGEMHSVFRKPNSLKDVFRHDPGRRRDDNYIHRTGTDQARPFLKAAIAKDYRRTAFASASAYDLGSLSLSSQSALLASRLKELESIDESDPQYAEMHAAVASFYRMGVGVDKNIETAHKYDLKAALLNSFAGQYPVLVEHYSTGSILELDDETKMQWLLNALTMDPFHSRYAQRRDIPSKLRAILEKLPAGLQLACLEQAFEVVHLTEFYINHSYGDREASDAMVHTMEGNVDSLRSLIRQTREGNEKQSLVTGLLHVAADYGHRAIIQMLVHEFHADIEALDEYGNTALEAAAYSGCFECVLVLLGLGASPRPLLDQNAFTTISMIGCRSQTKPGDSGGPGRAREMLRAVIEAGQVALPALQSPSSSTSTVDSLAQDLVDGRFAIENLDTDHDESHEDLPFFTPLQYCVSMNHFDSVFALSALGANPNVYNNAHPALHLAVMKKQPYMVAYLLASGADPNLREPPPQDALSPLHYANHFSGFIETPFDRLEKVRIRDFQETPVRDDKDDDVVAVKTIIHLLINAGCDIDAQDSEGRTALATAEEQSDRETADYLRRLGAQ